MADRVDELIEKYFIGDIVNRSEKRVGIEIELPILRRDHRPMEISFAQDLTQYMRQLGFTPRAWTLDGHCYMLESSNGDNVSFDTTWNTIEFSLKCERTLIELAERFYNYVYDMQGFAEKYGYTFCGRGLHPYSEHIDTTPLNTDILNAKSAFLKKYTSHHDGNIFFAVTASTQVHIDCLPDEYFSIFKLLRGLIFVDACLFANSPPPRAEALEILLRKHPVLAGASYDTVCFRDELYRLSEAPNSYPDNREFQSLDDIRRYLRELSIFIVTDGSGGYRPIEPIPLASYFTDGSLPEEDITCFRPLEPVAVSKYGTFELRGICTQPMAEVFQPAAFYVGLVSRRKQAQEILDSFISEQGISLPPMKLRERIARGKSVADKNALNLLISDLIDCARAGLIDRGSGEERLMRALSESKIIKTPAERESELFKSGFSMAEIVDRLSLWRLATATKYL